MAATPPPNKKNKKNPQNYSESTCTVKNENLWEILMSVPGYTKLVTALQMALGNDTTLSHAASHFCSMSDQSVVFVSARKNTRTEEVNLIYYPSHMASKELPFSPQKKAQKEALFFETQRYFLNFILRAQGRNTWWWSVPCTWLCLRACLHSTFCVLNRKRLMIKVAPQAGGWNRSVVVSWLESQIYLPQFKWLKVNTN